MREINIQARFGSFEVWYDEGAIANIFLLRKMAEKSLMSFEMDKSGGQFDISTRIGELHSPPSQMAYITWTWTTYRNSTRHLHKKQDETAAQTAFMVETVRKNYDGNTKEEMEWVISIRCLQGMLGNPSNRDFLAMAHAQMIPNCTYKVDD